MKIDINIGSLDAIVVACLKQERRNIKKNLASYTNGAPLKDYENLNKAYYIDLKRSLDTVLDYFGVTIGK